MDAIAAFVAREASEGEGVAEDSQRVGGRDIERHKFGARGRDVGDETAGARDDDGMMPGVAENAREFDGASTAPASAAPRSSAGATISARSGLRGPS
jgi:hypothetical protein